MSFEAARKQSMHVDLAQPRTPAFSGVVIGALIAVAPIYFYGKQAGVEKAVVAAAITYQEGGKDQ